MELFAASTLHSVLVISYEMLLRSLEVVSWFTAAYLTGVGSTTVTTLLNYTSTPKLQIRSTMDDTLMGHYNVVCVCCVGTEAGVWAGDL